MISSLHVAGGRLFGGKGTVRNFYHMLRVPKWYTELQGLPREKGERIGKEKGWWWWPVRCVVMGGDKSGHQDRGGV